MYIKKEILKELDLTYLEDNILHFKLPPIYRLFLLNVEEVEILDILDLSIYDKSKILNYPKKKMTDFSTLENLTNAWLFNANILEEEGIMPIASFEGDTTLAVGINEYNADQIFYWDEEMKAIFLCENIDIFVKIFS